MDSDNVEGRQNGIYSNSFDGIYPNAPNNGYDSNWAFASADNSGNLAGRNTSLYAPNWQQTSTSNAALDPYGRPYSKSPSFQQQSPYPPFDDPRQYQQSPFDPSLVSTNSADIQFALGHSPYGQPSLPGGTIAPHALENGPPRTVQGSRPSDQQAFLRDGSASSQPIRTIGQVQSVDQAALCAAIPKSTVLGNFSIIDYDTLATATNSKRMQAFINVGEKDFEYPINKAALPTPLRRRSRKELSKIAGDDPKLLAKLGKLSKKSSSVSRSVSTPKQRAPPKAIQTPSGIKYESVSSSEESSSEEDSDSSDDDFVDPSPLPPKRPDDAIEAVKYDTVKALWRSRYKEIPATDIRVGLIDIWEVLRTVRDRWKADRAAVTDAEEKKRVGELPLLQSRVNDQLKMMEAAMNAALEHGSRSILETMGSNESFLFLCYQFLLDRFNKKDFDGGLPRAMLKVLAICVTITQQNLDKTSLGKVLPRFAKKGNPETQALVKKIEAAVQTNEPKKNDASKVNVSADDKAAKAQVKSPLTARPAPESVAGVKRPASSVSQGQPAKKVASGVVGSAQAKALASAAATSKGPIKMTTAQPPVKTKPAVSKPSGFFSNLQSTTKKPGPQAIAKPAASSVVASAIKALDEKPAPTAAVMSSSKPSFSFADTIANLTKPKEEVSLPIKVEQKRAPETAEARKRRLRKESRRSLRVSFKPDSSLVEIRIFDHDPEDDVGHDASMTRDVSDVGGEGRMFKQHKDMVDVDDEDDGPAEEEIRTYTEPQMIDFADVEQDERDRNYARFGGGKLEAESMEKAAREKHEADTLMVFYTDPRDIPPTPKEPTETGEIEAAPLKQFGAPQGLVVERSVRIAGSRQQQQTQAAAAPDISAILAALTPQQQQTQQQQQPAAATDNNQLSEIQKILANFAQPAAQQQPAAQPAQNTSQAAPTPDLASIFASLGAQGGNHAPQQHGPPAMAQTGDPSANLAALFAQYGQAPPPINMGGYGGAPPALPFQVPNMGQQQQNYPKENEERRRWRENQDDGGSSQRPGKRQKSYEHPISKRFTQPCKYYHLGKCAKGDACTYLHT